MKNSNTLQYRVTQLEKNYDSLDHKIDDLLTNELPHLHESITKLNTKVTTLTVINVGALLLVALIAYLLKI